MLMVAMEITENDELFEAYVPVFPLEQHFCEQNDCRDIKPPQASCPIVAVQGQYIDNNKFEVIGGHYSGCTIDTEKVCINPRFLVLEALEVSERTNDPVPKMTQAIYHCMEVMFEGCMKFDVNRDTFHTAKELREQIQSWCPTHLIITGHGDENGLACLRWHEANLVTNGITSNETENVLVPSTVTGEEFRKIFDEDVYLTGVTVINFACRSGCAPFGQLASGSPNISAYIAPTENFDSKCGASFLSNLWINLFLLGQDLQTATDNAILDKSKMPMVVWRDGTTP